MVSRPSAKRSPLQTYGPEILAGAADNDPTTVAAVTVVGAQTTYRLSWLALLIAPMLAVVQMIAAQVGQVTGRDMQTLTMARFGRRPGFVLLLSVALVNVVTIAADLQAGAVSLGVLAGADSRWFVLPLGAAVVGFVFVGSYDEVVGVLRYVLLGFAAYAVAAFLAHPAWGRVLEASVVPRLSLNRTEIAAAVALLGTTLTSYVYVWETVERSEERPARDLRAGLAQVRTGALIGAVFTVVSFWFILVAAGATLGAHHRSVTTPDDAARALQPLAGHLAGDAFAAGLLVSALVALPVLMATTAYVVGSSFHWRRGLSERIGGARRFYAVVAASVGLGVAVDLAGVPAVRMLFVASVLGAFGTPISMGFLLLLARDPATMQGRPISARLATAGWLVAAVIAGFSLLLVVGAVTGAL